MSMIERAARALAKSESGHDDWDNLDPPLQDELRSNVRAVIAALREPSRWVSDAGEKYPGTENCHSIGRHDMHTAWTRMIDALLSEPSVANNSPVTAAD